MHGQIRKSSMTDVENLEKLIKDIFNVEKVVKNKKNTNKCISPLNSEPKNLFAENFIKRLKRLQKKYSADRQTIIQITEKVKNIAEARNSRWAGPYSELVALDFYSQFSEFFNLS